MAKAELIPFGKYKGQPVEALAQDKEYCEWLVAQDWFRAKFTAIHTLIVNNFGEPSETPEHNQLQARFTDPEFRRRFIWHLECAKILEGFLARRKQCLENGAKWCGDLQEEVARQRLELPAALDELEKAKYDENNPKDWQFRWKQDKVTRLSREIPANQERLDNTEALLVTLAAVPEPSVQAVKSTVEFEVSGIDVMLKYTVGGLHVRQPFEPDREYGYFARTLQVECKPSVSDDYPAVLRQIVAHDSGSGCGEVLFVGNGGYTGTGATLEQVKAIFASRQVRIVFLADLP